MNFKEKFIYLYSLGHLRAIRYISPKTIIIDLKLSNGIITERLLIRYDILRVNINTMKFDPIIILDENDEDQFRDQLYHANLSKDRHIILRLSEDNFIGNYLIVEFFE